MLLLIRSKLPLTLAKLQEEHKVWQACRYANPAAQMKTIMRKKCRGSHTNRMTPRDTSRHLGQRGTRLTFGMINHLDLHSRDNLLP